MNVMIMMIHIPDILYHQAKSELNKNNGLIDERAGFAGMDGKAHVFGQGGIGQTPVGSLAPVRPSRLAVFKTRPAEATDSQIARHFRPRHRPASL